MNRQKSLPLKLENDMFCEKKSTHFELRKIARHPTQHRLYVFEAKYFCMREKDDKKCAKKGLCRSVSLML